MIQASIKYLKKKPIAFLLLALPLAILAEVQAIAVALTIGGSIFYACVEIRIAVREIQTIGSRLAHHENFHERSAREAQVTHSDLDRRLSRLEGANGR